ncbi:putative oxidoreductase [Sphingomonas paucimobilis]|uniref:SDR family NAD(P)-dependent oxidoreductase n=1 Tax=Sphingobium sp. DC-2 TaxID=1303256 RepID=UPI00044F1911|nr:SDR family oxidoreductase [Sphingobium sp. DC-2]EZP71999.1 putative oxidoreductase [Sphingomonas paucimobilis]
MSGAQEGGCAFITGAGSGIGRALAIRLAERNHPLALVDLSHETIEETRRLALAAGAAAVSCHGGCDVSDAALVDAAAQAALAEHGSVRYVVPNAGVGFAVPLSQASLDDVRWVFGVNYFGAYHVIRALLPELHRRTGETNVLFVSSMAGILTPPGWHLGIYSGAKFAIHALAQGLRDDLGEGPVWVSVVYPGMVQTNVTANSKALRPGTGHAETDIPDEFKKEGMDPMEAARRILAGADRGQMDIFTHPGEIYMLRAYVERVEKGFAQSAQLVSRLQEGGGQ